MRRSESFACVAVSEEAVRDHVCSQKGKCLHLDNSVLCSDYSGCRLMAAIAMTVLQRFFRHDDVPQ
jgi:hypothetical protein